MEIETALTATLSASGQVTLPVEVVEALGARVGDRIAFQQVEPGTFTLAVKRVDLRALAGVLRQYARAEGPLAVDDMNEAIGDAVVQSYERSVR